MAILEKYQEGEFLRKMEDAKITIAWIKSEIKPLKEKRRQAKQEYRDAEKELQTLREQRNEPK